MGGIAGTVKLDGSFAERDDLERAQKLLAHRGSNKKRIHIDRELGMAHNRMAILDISDKANQPMSAFGERYWISFDGELYNFIELKTELQKAGYQFKSDSDTEVALAAFVAWGADCFSHFNGVWALVIWDAEERVLTLSRDPFGVKPLYYFSDERVFAYSSEIKGFLGYQAIRLEMDINQVATIYHHPSEVHATEITPWKRVKKVLPGHFLQLHANDGKLVRKRWWQPLDQLPEVPADLKDRTEKFKDLLFQSCKLRMRADIPIGLCVSGGVTSSSIWATVQRLAKEPFPRIAPDCRSASLIALPGGNKKELDAGEALIASMKGKRKQFKAHPEDYAKDIQDLVYAFESLQEVSIERWILYRSLTQNDIRLTLEGIGADALLGRTSLGVMHYALDQVREIQSAKGALKNPNLWRDFVDQRRLPKMSKTAPQHELDPDDFKKTDDLNLAKGVPEDVTSPFWEQDRVLMEERDLFFQAKYYCTHGGLLQHELFNAEAASMVQGVQLRMPFLDPELFRYCLALPSESMISHGQTQLILRKAMEGILPEGILESPRQFVLESIHSTWFDNLLQEVILECISSFNFRSFSSFKGKEVKALVKQKRYAEAWPYIQAFLLNERFMDVRDELFPEGE